MQQKIHTGCSCKRCRSGKSGKHNWIRKYYHRMMRRIYKRELKNKGEITNVNKSIGYTD